MTIKLAYIDHRLQFIPKSFLQSLKEADINFRPYSSLEEFLGENNLREFSVMICHPGLNNQGLLGKITKEFPHLKLGLISFTEYEYFCEEDGIPAFSYNIPESVVKWIIENQ